jgi:hypothetical protein
LNSPQRTSTSPRSASAANVAPVPWSIGADFFDRGVARATARFLRLTTSAEGLLVPSVAFLDDLSRRDLVLFLDKLPADVTSYMSATFHRTVRVSP